jgi:FlaA1/EpsC-like NDP-sugar epimerase
MVKLGVYKKVVVTGGAGTCGDRIIEELLKAGTVEEVVSLDNDEGKLFFQRERYKRFDPYHCTMVDIRDGVALTRVFKGADLVIHCAAYKNVPMCEMSPTSCVDVNIKGTENVIESAISSNVKKVLFTSTDKAVNPTNIMGATKLVGERLIMAANLLHSDTVFAATRFGNVLGSTGSVLPIFISQIKNGFPLTITDPNMTRFMMSQQHSARLVLESVERAAGGEIFITKMPVLEIGTFAEALYDICIDESIATEPFDENKHMEVIGARSGEKDYEELMSLEELPRSKDAGEFIVVLPNGQDAYGSICARRLYQEHPKPSHIYNSHEESALQFDKSKAFILDVLGVDSFDLMGI